LTLKLEKTCFFTNKNNPPRVRRCCGDTRTCWGWRCDSISHPYSISHPRSAVMPTYNKFYYETWVIIFC